MAITYTWEIVGVQTYPTLNGNSDVVFNADWKCTGTETIGDKTYEQSLSGSNLIPYKGGDSFTAFDDLTEETVLKWLFDAMGTQIIFATQENIAALIGEQKTPVVQTPDKPWANSESEFDAAAQKTYIETLPVGIVANVVE